MGLSDDLDDFDAEPSVDVDTDDMMDTGVARVASGARVWSDVEVLTPERNDESTKIAVAGYWKDDEPPEVEMVVSRDYVNLHLDMSTERARSLAAELMLAANRADEGDDELEEDGK